MSRINILDSIDFLPNVSLHRLTHQSKIGFNLAIRAKYLLALTTDHILKFSDS